MDNPMEYLRGVAARVRMAGAKEEEAQPPRVPGTGVMTGCALGDVEALLPSIVRDPFQRLRPAFSKKAAALSLELAQMTYSLELEPWVEAGWNDFSIQIDDTLQSGVSHSDAASGERMRMLINNLKLRRAKMALNEHNPVAQILGALRQRERSDTIKAVCMMHPTGDGSYLLAIGFMGTGKRFYDWISNFRFTTEEGFHKGFYQLCTYFEQSEEKIVFPETAAELGEEKLTLRDVLTELRSPRSRFRLWMAGHSQGGAVMQVFCHRLMSERGVLAQNMVGYGFASPTVAVSRLVVDPAAYPLYHILNSDDMVPRMGALMHLGLSLQYDATDAMREATYHLSALPADVAAREALRNYETHMVDTASILVSSTAFLQCLAEEKGEDGLNNLMNRPWSFAAVDKVLMLAGDKAQSWLERLVLHAQNGHEAVTGKPMDEAELEALRSELRPIVQGLPFRRLMGAVAGYCVPPHHLRLEGSREDGAYAYIVKNGLDALRPFIWIEHEDRLPEKRFAEAFSTTPTQTATLPQKRRQAPHPASVARGKRRIGITASKRG